MELKTGYKQTEVGVIPEDWRICQLREVCTVLRGGSPRPIEDYLTENGDGINWIKIGDVGAGAKYIDSTAERILPSGMSRSRHVKPGDFLLSNSMSFGRPYILRIDDCIHDGWLVIGSYQTTFSSEYLYYCLSSDGILAQYSRYAAGSSVLNLNKDIVSRVHVAIPGLQEQAKISKVLGEVDQLIEKLEGLIYKKKNIKQAAMQELLTGKRRLPGFEGEWEVRELGSLGTWRGGMTPSMQNPDYWNQGDFPWISSGDVKISRLSDTSQHVTAHAVSSGAAVVIPAKSIVLVTRSGILRKQLPVSLLERPMAINQDIKALIPARDIDSSYLLHALTWAGSQILKSCMKTGTTVESVEFAWLKRFTIPVPSHEEQIAIAKALSDMEDELAEIEAHRTKASALKQGTMQQLLTGKIRLT